ncbi:MAG: hypothetical protein FWG44_05205 [Oscillospiraceae bacterium]|nr:hypothetical protein [Oscillospiraceae bacterium]
MFKKALIALLAVCMVVAFTATASADTDVTPGTIESEDDASVDAGFVIYTTGDAVRVNIAPAGGFVDGENYRLTFTVTSTDDFSEDNGIRVRWTGGFGYPDNADNDIVNDYETDSAYSANVPAYFRPVAALASKGGSQTFVVEFTYGAEDMDYSVVDSACIVGRWTDAFSVSNVKLESGITFGGAATTEEVTETTEVETPETTPGTTTTNEVKDGAPTGVGGIATVAGIALVATAGVVISVKRRK